MIRLPKGLKEDEILRQVQEEFQLGFSAILTKRQIFRNRLRLYNEVLKDPNKISSNLIYLMMQTFMSVEYTEDLTVEFASREIWNQDEAENLQRLAEFDQEEMNVAEMNYWVKWNRLFYGVGIRTLQGRATYRKCALRAVRDPLAWIPDPAIQFVNNKLNARFHGFQVETNIVDLKNDPEYDKDAVEELTRGIEGELMLNKQAKQQNRGIQPNVETIEREGVGIYHHYTKLSDGFKYIITTDIGCRKILRFQKINPVGKEEKNNPDLIEFPVVINYFSPYPGDPFGVSVPDLVEDKQRARSVILNLNKIKATREALGGLYIYDTNAVKNRNDLLTPAVNGPKFIGVDGSRVQGNLQNVVSEVQQQRINPDAINFPEIIMNEIYLSTGMDARGMGLASQGGITLGENQRLQANQNLKLLLNNRINGWGEKMFWSLWYRCYKEFFSAKDEKMIEINTGFNTMNITLKKDDFITIKDPHIKIVNRNDKKTQDEEERVNFMALFPIVVQDPNTPNISKMFAKRKAFKLSGMSRNEIDILVPPSPEEIQAKMDLELINRNEMPSKIKDVANEDHLTYLIIYMSAIDTDAKFQAIEARKKAYAMQQKMKNIGMTPQSPEQGMGSAAGIATNQLMNSAVQFNKGKGSVSAQDVK